MADMRREDSFFQKKVTSYFAADLKEGTESYDLALGSGNHLLATLPERSIITNAYIHVKTVSDAATTNAATLGTASAGAQILTGGNLKSAGKTGTFVSGQVETGTGVDLWFNVTVTGAQTAVGEYVVVVEYLEYAKDNGEYTLIPNV